jgi:2-polyprenyl-3-methyl-5-hydroxy-6-metoxy-1,4-benzoquinol methylase
MEAFSLTNPVIGLKVEVLKMMETLTENFYVLKHKDGEAIVYRLPDGRRRVEIKSEKYVPVESCVTSYTDELIKITLEVQGLTYLAEAISRDEDPSLVHGEIESNLFDFCERSVFSAGKRFLDFGCGSGASTMCMARMLPSVEIVGVELQPHLKRLAEARKAHHKLDNVRFLLSPSGTELPPDTGEFDFVMMSAVYEHLLPEERKITLLKVWDVLKPGGILFINQTPHRWFPIEAHSSGLPLINYLPESLAFAAARKFSRIAPMHNYSREEMLRGGIRGATEFEIMRTIRQNSSYNPILLNPLKGDRIDLWYSRLSPNYKTIKLVIKWAMKSVKSITGHTVIQNLTLALQKSS